MAERFARLYHLAEASNLPSILRHDLLSTQQLVKLAGIDATTSVALFRNQRSTNQRIADGITVQDQRPMPASALAPALDDGLEPSDGYALLNGFFFWPDRERMERQKNACGDRPQVVLTFDGAALLNDFAPSAYVSPINSGNARRKPARRGRETFVALRKMVRVGLGETATVSQSCRSTVRKRYPDTGTVPDRHLGRSVSRNRESI